MILENFKQDLLENRLFPSGGADICRLRPLSAGTYLRPFEQGRPPTPAMIMTPGADSRGAL